MTESTASRTRADARTVIADLLYQHHTGGDIVNADEFVAALRSHGYAVVPVEPTDEMVAAYEQGIGLKTTREWWRTMIAAAPQSSTPDTA